MNVEERIINWVEDSPYWMQYASLKILEGLEVNDNLINECYSLFIEDEGLKEKDVLRRPIELPGFSISEAPNEQIRIKSIKNIKNVNALEEGQEIPISDQITIIFGENGSGKSGYVRLLNNSFKSRGDKEIIPNIFGKGIPGQPECTFKVLVNDQEIEVLYPSDQNHPIFRHYAIFDSKASQTQLTQENDLIFTPKGFGYFEKIMILVNALKIRLQTDIQMNATPNEFLIHFKFENEIHTFVNSLSFATNIDKLEEFGIYSQQDQELLENLIYQKKELKEENIPKKVEELNKRKSELIKIGESIHKYKALISNERITQYNSLIETKILLDKANEKEGLKMFDGIDIAGIGTTEWKNFIVSAKQYKDALKRKNIEMCLLCLQPLNIKERNLYDSYWKLLESQIQKELIAIKRQIEQQLVLISRLDNIQFDSSSLLYNFFEQNFPDSVNRLHNIIKFLTERKRSILEQLKTGNKALIIDEFDLDILFIDEILVNINEQSKKLIESDPSNKISQIQIKINILNDKKLLSQLIPSIITWVQNLRWAENAKLSLSKLKTNSITILQGELFETYVTGRYKEVFDEECKILGAPEIVEINQRNAKGATLRRLQVNGSSANKILSEGEQKAIALADFLTETGLDDQIKGIILDDPITSLDYLRRDYITKRLVKESKQKQVVIFTHNISFLLRLQQFAVMEEINCLTTTIRRIRDSIGIVKPELPWVAQNVANRVKYLRNYLVGIKKVETQGDPDDYNREIKNWFGLLREGWERAVEERLLKGVVVRFGLEVQTQRLKRLKITEEFLSSIEKGMTESSNWTHDSAAGLSPTIPSVLQAEVALNEFDEFCKKCEP